MTSPHFEPVHAGLFIGGEWRPGNRQLEVRDPACFDQLVGTATRGSVADVDEAVAAAKAAQPGWAKIGFRERAALLAQVLDRLDRDFEARAILYVSANGSTME